MRFPGCKRYIVTVLSLVFLGGCSSGQKFEDLEDFMAERRARPGGKIEPMPVLQIHEGFKYGAMTLRSPFDPPATVVASRTSGKSTVKPDNTRAKQVLEDKSFVSLSMVGLLERRGVRSVLISDGEEIHRVGLGDYLGRNNGQIVTIAEDKIEVIEIIPDGDGGWVERPRSLPLKEKTL